MEDEDRQSVVRSGSGVTGRLGDSSGWPCDGEREFATVNTIFWRWGGGRLPLLCDEEVAHTALRIEKNQSVMEAELARNADRLTMLSVRPMFKILLTSFHLPSPT